MPGRMKAIAAGVAAVVVLWAIGIAWPMTAGYPSLLHWLGDRIIADHEPRFDRSRLNTELARAGFALGDPAHVRIFKRERRLEVWLRRQGAAFSHFKSYDICNFSGGLGPKLAEGDRQAPEGFYRVARSQLNPNSRHHLSFNLGFPNAFDRSLGRTGSALMVHGGCTSIGCYAITDEGVDEVYAVVEAALHRGQDAVDVHAFPFALTDSALAAEIHAPWVNFWSNLKLGYDLFEARRLPPKVATCNGEYRFGDDAEGPGCVAFAAWS
jgi:murein L,D-transpeptidase YafK